MIDQPISAQQTPFSSKSLRKITDHNNFIVTQSTAERSVLMAGNQPIGSHLHAAKPKVLYLLGGRFWHNQNMAWLEVLVELLKKADILCPCCFEYGDFLIKITAMSSYKEGLPASPRRAVVAKPPGRFWEYHGLARDGINMLLNNGFEESQKLFKNHR